MGAIGVVHECSRGRHACVEVLQKIPTQGMRLNQRTMMDDTSRAFLFLVLTFSCHYYIKQY